MAVLPTLPVTAIDLGLRTRARGAGESAQAVEHVVDEEKRRAGEARGLVRDTTAAARRLEAPPRRSRGRRDCRL